ncbi:putative mRNA splicing factor SYF2 [Dioscorea sansibarensis]
MMEKERRIRSVCVNASNPYHTCADYCARSSPVPGVKPSPRLRWINLVMKNNKKNKEIDSDGSDGEPRDVDPLCVNASNPYHKCADYCSLRMTPSVKTSASKPVWSEEKRKEGVKPEEKRKVDSGCVNAQNP